MNRINEIGDTPRGQYMLGRLSQSYDEPNLFTDDYDEEPKIASYASKNWKGYGRGDDNARAFDLGKGDEANTKWIDDGSQRRFRERYKLPKLENNQRTNMNKKLIRLTEGDLHRIVKESVNRLLNEIGDTKRGQYMLGRLKNKQSNGGGKFRRGINYNDAGDYAYKVNGNSYSDDYQQGYENEEKYGRNADSTWDGDKYRRMKFNYDTKQMEDMDNIGKRFIDFIEKYHGGVLLQTIVDFETGNETGTPTSPLPTIISEFEDAVIGHKCTLEMRKAIKAAYNQWWFYAQDQLIPTEN